MHNLATEVLHFMHEVNIYDDIRSVLTILT